MKIDLPELERKLSYGINLTIKESTILLESMKGFIDDKIELQEQLNTTKKALTEISEVKNLTPFKKGFETSKAVSKARDMRNTARQALAAIGGDDE
ncbi:hypothetical protein M5C73_08830 [Lactococcus lactis]|uniref:hypothetical protein n=1 Tax=Lactococcus lactis TaxID=1358 RepID=UPI0020787EDC|nr:hypothetical protein [Lactococcus lactis]USI47470.1 hypothetical protein M5C73_08830 [Lactococcus lactis]